jgi:putative ABC transport system permease protein
MVSPLQRKLLRDLVRMWPQLLAAALVMSCGIATLTMSLSTVTSLERARDAYYERYRFPHVFAHLKRAPRALAARIAEIPGVRSSAARVVVDVSLDVPGLAEPAVGRLVSIPDTPPFGVAELHVRRGRLPQPGHASEVVASEPFVDAHGFVPGDSVKAIINGRLQTLTIVGVAISPEYVYQIRPGDVFPDDRRFGVFWMLQRELAPAFDLDGAFNDVALALTPGASEARVIDVLDRLTAPYGGQGAYTRRDQTSDRYIADELSQLRGMAAIPPTIFLSAAAFILNIVFSCLVRTQREQVAALKAFGYARRAIAWHYLQMALAVSVVGIALGALAGWRFGLAMTEMYTRFFRFPVFEFSLDGRAVVLAGGIGAAAATLGAAAAVRRAALLPPAEAMRPEAPPDYRATLAERLGAQRFFGPAGRMVLRHLERQPVRAVLSTLGIALSIAVLVVGSFVHGAIERLVDIVFSSTQRQDLSVLFVEPATPRAAHEVARLPGVLACEPFRVVPARLRAGPRAELQGITALVPDPSLNRVIDERERPVAPPPDGLMLSDALARRLEVGAGDTVTLEILEGQRPVLEVRVGAVVGTYVGTAAYMRLDALRRLVREDDVVSGAFLRADPARAGELYRRLKETPRVASVNIKRAALDAFRSTMAENLLRMRLFNLIFASIIAFGVIYNSARISLAERAHELATLRILGFTRAEVSVILLGELGALTVAAIPIGLLLGRSLAWVVTRALGSESVRVPFVVSPGTYAFAVTVILLAALVSGLVVRRGIDSLDLVQTLKTKG